MPMTEQHFQGLSPEGFHRVNYTQWGDPDNTRVLICVHGLTRTGRDFDILAEAMSDEYRVICPDIVGRGKSAWLNNKSGYNYPQYAADMNALIARSGAETLDWVGTSMGGLIGMSLAWLPGCPIRKMVINDVGPFISKQGVQRIADYVGVPISFPTLDELDAWQRQISKSFGPLTDEQWKHMIAYNARQLEDGSYTFGYDPGISQIFKEAAIDDVNLWPMWDAMKLPVLLIRGERSDILSSEDAMEMTQRGPKADLRELPGIGHAPALMADDQVALVRDWLLYS